MKILQVTTKDYDGNQIDIAEFKKEDGAVARIKQWVLESAQRNQSEVLDELEGREKEELEVINDLNNAAISHQKESFIESLKEIDEHDFETSNELETSMGLDFKITEKTLL
ncbi:hypothetical protein [Psychrobacter sp. 1044]|uniref:hypothetical protein n=1 Tax=Psychrobacter sp. 1044 TaxID=2772562 RepID=UPI0019186DF0|nr:hypothetical protein [Psychrobacter sp. 1044]